VGDSSGTAIVMSTGQRLAVTFAPAQAHKHGSKLGKTQDIVGNSRVFVGNPGHWVNLGPRGKRDTLEELATHNDWWCSRWTCRHWHKLAPRGSKWCPNWYPLLIPHWQAVTKLDTTLPLLQPVEIALVLARGVPSFLRVWISASPGVQA
jgi:hypothetical protein